jgi:succinate dehydrogenase / fumarate reductase cytochrome b subunit
MGWIRSFYRSTIGKKVVMALTGILGVGFVTGHMLGNLLVFRGPEAINGYAEFLKSNRALLWAIRLTLLAVVTLHVHAAWSLTRLAQAARPDGYDRHPKQVATFSARSLRVGGVILLVFLVFHLLQFTVGTLHPAFSPTDVYGNVMIGLSVPAVAAFYLLAMAALALHLHHGVWSLFQTMGWNHPHINPLRRRLAALLAVVIAVGFAAVPLAVAFGLVG